MLCAVVPSLAVAVHRPAAYVCSTLLPSVEVPSPKSQCNDVPSALKVTRRGAGPDVGDV
jgi:hypothetical protein